MTAPGEPVPPPNKPRYCPGCGRSLDETDRFCPFCGRSLTLPYAQSYAYRPPTTKESAKRFGRAVTLIALAALFMLLVVNVIILIWSPVLVLPETADPANGNTLFLVIPWADPLVPLFDLTGWAFAIYHISLVVAISASFAWMAVRSYGTFRKELSLERPKDGHSPLWVIGTVFFAVLAMNSIYALLLSFFNIEPTLPSFSSRELWQLLDGYASASVWEELVTRVLYIGVPLLVIDLVYHKRKGVLRYFIGGGFKIGGLELALIWLSAGIFALAHIVYWDAWKIVPTWIAGLAFGYLFLRLGLYACILLHFAVDYLSIPLEISGGSVAVTLALGLLLLFWDLVGAAYIVVYVNRMVRFLLGTDLKVKDASKPAPTAANVAKGPYQQPPSSGRSAGPAPSGPPPGSGIPYYRGNQVGFYSCIKCGNTQARYNEGMLECTRCGHRE